MKSDTYTKKEKAELSRKEADDLKHKIIELKKKEKAEIKSIKQKTLNEICSIDYKTANKIAKINEKALFKSEKKQKKLQKKAFEATLPKRYSIGEEIFNSISHGIGAGLSIAALVLLIVRAVFFAPQAEKSFYITGFTIFGASLFVLYIMSTLYHALTPYGVKKVFGIFDHSSIYFLIAGTYTPFCLGPLRNNYGWVLFGIIWGLAIAGITFYAIFGSKIRILSVITYILMGYLIIFAIKPMKQILPSITIIFLLIGGVAYTVGVVFYAMKKHKWTHSIWHLFVLAGSIFHFFSVYYSI